MALEEVQQRKAGWTEADLIRAINAALPDYLGVAEGREIGELLDRLAAEALECATPLDAARPGHEQVPAELRLVDGQSAYQAPGGRLYATPAHVHTERALVAAAAGAGNVAMPAEIADRFLTQLANSGVELGVGVGHPRTGLGHATSGPVGDAVVGLVVTAPIGGSPERYELHPRNPKVPGRDPSDGRLRELHDSKSDTETALRRRPTGAPLSGSSPPIGSSAGTPMPTTRWPGTEAPRRVE